MKKKDSTDVNSVANANTTQIVKTANKALVEFQSETKAIVRSATDNCNLPIVRSGYLSSGKPHTMVFVNLHAMAMSRLKKIFPNFDPNDVLMGRLLAEAKLICSKIIVKKYEARNENRRYDHLSDADETVKKFIDNNYEELRNKVKLLTNEDN